MLRDVNDDDDDDDTFFVCGGVGVLCVTREYRRELFSFEKKKRETKAHSFRVIQLNSTLSLSRRGRKKILYKEKRLLLVLRY